uniref:COMM domain-containing protein 6 n=1 Tax=Chelydra serpentina TaxID=8475 RepID=A0A8C3SBK4_CHESE
MLPPPAGTALAAPIGHGSRPMGAAEPVIGAEAVHKAIIDIQWKLGMAVSSDNCRSLKYPYVTMTLKVAEPSGQIKNKSFEMTIPQFQVCNPVSYNCYFSKRVAYNILS